MNRRLFLILKNIKEFEKKLQVEAYIALLEMRERELQKIVKEV